MQFSQIFAVIAIAGSAVAVPNHNVELAKRACWELSGEALTICQDACKAVCVCFPSLKYLSQTWPASLSNPLLF